jgi:hypothetical protein
MFQINTQQIGSEQRHAVTGEVGSSRITILATSELQACEIARALNEAAGVEVEDLTEVVPAPELNERLPAWMAAHAADENRDLQIAMVWLRGEGAERLTPAEQLAETQLRG